MRVRRSRKTAWLPSSLDKGEEACAGRAPRHRLRTEFEVRHGTVAYTCLHSPSPCPLSNQEVRCTIRLSAWISGEFPGGCTSPPVGFRPVRSRVAAAEGAALDTRTMPKTGLDTAAASLRTWLNAQHFTDLTAPEVTRFFTDTTTEWANSLGYDAWREVPLPAHPDHQRHERLDLRLGHRSGRGSPSVSRSTVAANSARSTSSPGPPNSETTPCGSDGAVSPSASPSRQPSASSAPTSSVAASPPARTGFPSRSTTAADGRKPSHAPADPGQGGRRQERRPRGGG